MSELEKKYLEELQVISDKHESLKSEVQNLLDEGDSIKDKLKDVDRVFELTEVVNQIFKEISDLEEEYDKKLEEYKKIKNKE